LKIRDIELENIKKLRQMDGIVVLKHFNDIKKIILKKKSEKKK